MTGVSTRPPGEIATGGSVHVRWGEIRFDRRRGRVAFTSLLSVAVLSAVSCTACSADAGPSATLTISPANGSRGVLPGAAVTVAAKNGKLRDVTVATAAGPVRGYFAANGTWHGAEPLATGTSYTVTATPTGTNQKKVTTSATFQPCTPHQTFGAIITAIGTNQNISSEISARQYGVGIPI